MDEIRLILSVSFSFRITFIRMFCQERAVYLKISPSLLFDEYVATILLNVDCKSLNQTFIEMILFSLLFASDVGQVKVYLRNKLFYCLK